MKKGICILLLATVAVGFTGCSGTVETEKVYNTEPQNQCLLKWNKLVFGRLYTIKKTKVMYAVSGGYYNQGNFTLLVDENGNPRIWDGDWPGYKKG